MPCFSLPALIYFALFHSLYHVSLSLPVSVEAEDRRLCKCLLCESLLKMWPESDKHKTSGCRTQHLLPWGRWMERARPRKKHWGGRRRRAKENKVEWREKRWWKENWSLQKSTDAISLDNEIKFFKHSTEMAADMFYLFVSVFLSFSAEELGSPAPTARVGHEEEGKQSQWGADVQKYTHT